MKKLPSYIYLRGNLFSKYIYFIRTKWFWKGICLNHINNEFIRRNIHCNCVTFPCNLCHPEMFDFPGFYVKRKCKICLGYGILPITLSELT